MPSKEIEWNGAMCSDSASGGATFKRVNEEREVIGGESINVERCALDSTGHSSGETNKLLALLI